MTLPDYTHFNSIEYAAKIFAPLFVKKYTSADAFYEQLKSQLIRAVKNYIKEDTHYTSFDGFPNQAEFSLALNNLWKTRETKDTESTIGFTNGSTEYLFMFEPNNDGTINFEYTRDANGTFQVEPETGWIIFKNIADAIASLSPLFEKSEGSDALFFKQFKQIIARKRSKILSSTATEPPLKRRKISSSTATEPPLNVKDTDKILPAMKYERILDQMHSQVRSEDPAALKGAFETLQKMKFSSVLQIGDDLQFMPIPGLVLYYLNIIQLNETPEAIQMGPHYAENAFQNIDGCTSTADQRTRALQYTQADMLFYALELALTDKDNSNAQRLVARIQEVGAQMPSSISTQLMQFDLDFTQGSKVQLHSLIQTRNAMKQALNLP